MKLVKVVVGSLLMLSGIGFVSLGVYIVLFIFSFASLGGFTVLLGFGAVLFYVGYLLMRGESIKDALYFLSFFQ